MRTFLKQSRGLIIVALGLIVLFPFQNCSNPNMKFTGPENLSSSEPVYEVGIEQPGDVQCIDFKGDVQPGCHRRENGLEGTLHYLLDKTDGQAKASHLWDRFDQTIPFTPEAINSANVIIERGYVNEKRIRLSQLDVPTTHFTEGFRISETDFLRDVRHKILIEAFALDLRSNLILPAGMEPGNYEIALISDDGSQLDMDLNQDGSLEPYVNNDRQQSTRMACSRQSIALNGNSKIPIRVRYFQGPRTEIALMMIMRKLNSQESAGQDSNCGRGTTGRSLESEIPAQRGWFIVKEDMLLLK